MGFKLKESAPIIYHLGYGFIQGSDRTFYQNLKKKEKFFKEDFVWWLGYKLSNTLCPTLEKGDHLELDNSKFLEEEEIEQYQSMIGSLQWLVSIERWDLLTHIMTVMSSFRSTPKFGHMERAKQVCAFSCNFKHFKLRYRIGKSDHSHLNKRDAVNKLRQ